jgi:hypothetical protein
MLELCRDFAAEEPAAALAVARWESWQAARAASRPRDPLAGGATPVGRRESRFRRRAYERARDGAAGAVLMRIRTHTRRGSHGGPRCGGSDTRAARSGGRRAHVRSGARR